MKKILFLTAVGILMTSSVFAKSKTELEEATQVNQETESLRGFNLGFEVNALTDENISGAVAKIDLIGGYRFNNYFSLNFDLWTVYMLAFGIEVNPRFHIPTNSKVSPYFGVSAGYMTFGFLETIAEEISGDDLHFFTVSAGPGIDIALSDQTTLNIGLKYRGLISTVSSSVGIDHGMEGGVGVRWRF